MNSSITKNLKKSSALKSIIPRLFHSLHIKTRLLGNDVTYSDVTLIGYDKHIIVGVNKQFVQC